MMISLPLPPKIIKKKGNWARFEVEALYPGYGVTIGNSLRRVLLSSLPGAAVTQVKIKGVQHEFSTIPGVLEDVINIMLNLKQLRFKIHGSESQRATLKVKGEKEIKGSDFKLPTQLELVNKEAHIASLTAKNAEIDMEILVEKGLGYEPVESRKKGKLEIGEIALDAIFTPVRKLNYHVENMRVGERTDFDRLILEVETDGTISPQEAVYQASEILIKHFSLLSEALKKTVKKPKKEISSTPSDQVPELIQIKVEDLKLSPRYVNALLKNNIKTVGGILKKSETKLLKLKGISESGVKEIKKALKKLGLELK